MSFFQLQPPGIICSITWEHHKQLQLCRCFTVYPVHLQCLSPHLSDLNMAVFQRTLTDIFFLSRSFETNYILIIFSVIFLALYVVVLVICRKADVSIQKTTGSFLLPENNPSDRFLCAVTIDTGLRSRTRMTAKVLIIVMGNENESEILIRDHCCMNFWIFVYTILAGSYCSVWR